MRQCTRAVYSVETNVFRSHYQDVMRLVRFGLSAVRRCPSSDPKVARAVNAAVEDLNRCKFGVPKANWPKFLTMEGSGK